MHLLQPEVGDLTSVTLRTLWNQWTSPVQYYISIQAFYRTFAFKFIIYLLYIVNTVHGYGHCDL